ncbi:hypothetical protein D3C76_1340230 [compost metagenome]
MDESSQRILLLREHHALVTERIYVAAHDVLDKRPAESFVLFKRLTDNGSNRQQAAVDSYVIKRLISSSQISIKQDDPIAQALYFRRLMIK